MRKRTRTRRFSAVVGGSVEGGGHVLQCLDFVGSEAGVLRDGFHRQAVGFHLAGGVEFALPHL